MVVGCIPRILGIFSPHILNILVTEGPLLPTRSFTFSFRTYRILILILSPPNSPHISSLDIHVDSSMPSTTNILFPVGWNTILEGGAVQGMAV